MIQLMINCIFYIDYAHTQYELLLSHPFTDFHLDD